MAIIGVSLLIGDGIITPAISIMSAVEGSLLIPGLENLSKTIIVIISMVIAILLFLVQKRGTEKVAGAFGPITAIWFVSLAVSGIASIADEPADTRSSESALGDKISHGKRFCRIYCSW